MSTFSQKDRPIAVETPLGKDVLVLTSFNGTEEFSRLFAFQLDLLSKKEDIKPQDIIGKSVSFSVLGSGGSPRYFNGFVNRFAFVGTSDRGSFYRAQAVPWLWFLTRTTDCRIFQNKSVPDVIKKIFGDLGFSDFQLQLSGSHPAWEYCIQYRETDFNFVSRLMEQEGIFYYFKHEQGKHTLVIGDNPGAYTGIEDSSVQFLSNLSQPEPTDQIKSWQHQYEFRSGKSAQTDYNFETPTTDLMTTANTVVQLQGNTKYELYDYPGEYEKKGDGQAEVKIRMEEEEAWYDVVQGASHCSSFSPGGKFTIAKHHAKAEQGKTYVITGVRHLVDLGGSYISGGTSSSIIYQNSFSCIPSSVTYRPPRITHKPVIQGVQTALVVGPPGEEIWPDKYGRIKIQMHWDREGKKDENSSCWVRVANPWSGSNWGMIHIPRIGQEVVVSHLEGDPDRPLITAMVYNAKSMPPYSLPGNKTQSGIKSRSSNDGDEDKFNELRFEDKKGQEEIYFHAEKNFTRIVENNDSLKVGFDKKDDGDQTIEIFNNQSLKIGTPQSKDGSQTIEIWKDRKTTLQTGNESVTITLGKSETEALQSIELKVGQSSVLINQMGVTIKGMMIQINGQMMTQVQGMMTQLQGSAMLQASGGITMIN